MGAYSETARGSSLPHMVGAELLKLRTRWVPYILLVMTIAVLGLVVFGTYATWKTSDIVGGDLEAFRGFAWPYSFATIFSTTHSFGSILLPILVAVMVGSEYAWGTARPSLIRGQTRGQYLTSKLLTIVLLGFVGMVIAVSFGLLFSTIATRLADLSVTLDLPRGTLSAGEIAMMAVRTFYVTLVYVFLAFALAEVWRSSMAGIGGIIVYAFAEAILIGILSAIGGRSADFRDVLIGHNVSSLLNENRIADFDFVTFHLRPLIFVGDLPNPLQATLVLAAYSLFFIGIAYLSFYRRDVRI